MRHSIVLIDRTKFIENQAVRARGPTLSPLAHPSATASRRLHRPENQCVCSLCHHTFGPAAVPSLLHAWCVCNALVASTRLGLCGLAGGGGVARGGRRDVAPRAWSLRKQDYVRTAAMRHTTSLVVVVVTQCFFVDQKSFSRRDPP